MNSNQQKKKNYEGGGGGGEKEMLHELQSTKKGQQLSTTITSSPPSSTTCSPSHEFSFTISLHSNEKTITNTKSKSKTPTNTLSPPHNSFAIDLSPADDIFFHGHLLPLHLLSHLPISPRSSTNSLDSFTLPIKELQDNDYKKPTTTTTNTNTNTTVTTNNSTMSNNIYNNTREINGRIKAKSFSFLKFPRRAKGSEFEEREKEMEKKKKKTGGFNMIQIIRRYAKMVRPLLFYKNGSGKTSTTTTKRETAAGAGHFDFEREPYSSFSGNLSLRGSDSNKKKRESRGRRGEFSAPASMWTSPTNSGLLFTTPLGVHSSSSESSMEELQSAIQAAIAHCKNSSTPIKDGDNKLQS